MECESKITVLIKKKKNCFNKISENFVYLSTKKNQLITTPKI
jgi:hypothetical protein